MERRLWDFNPGEKALAETANIELKYKKAGFLVALPLALFGVTPLVPDTSIFDPLNGRQDVHILDKCIIVGSKSTQVTRLQAYEAGGVVGDDYLDYSKPGM